MVLFHHLINGEINSDRIENEKPLPKAIDMVWYSITENKVYSLQQDLPYETIKTKIENSDISFKGLLFTIVPYGQVSLYFYNPINHQKDLIATFQGEEFDLAINNLETPLYTTPDAPAQNWQEYQSKALANFDKATTFLFENGLPPKEFDFWSDQNIYVVEHKVPENEQINELNENSETPLIDAVRSQNNLLALKLISAGADVNIQHTFDGQPSGLNALNIAESGGFNEIVTALKAAGAN